MPGSGLRYYDLGLLFEIVCELSLKLFPIDNDDDFEAEAENCLEASGLIKHAEGCVTGAA